MEILLPFERILVGKDKRNVCFKKNLAIAFVSCFLILSQNTINHALLLFLGKETTNLECASLCVCALRAMRSAYVSVILLGMNGSFSFLARSFGLFYFW